MEFEDLMRANFCGGKNHKNSSPLDLLAEGTTSLLPPPLKPLKTTSPGCTALTPKIFEQIELFAATFDQKNKVRSPCPPPIMNEMQVNMSFTAKETLAEEHIKEQIEDQDILEETGSYYSKITSVDEPIMLEDAAILEDTQYPKNTDEPQFLSNTIKDEGNTKSNHVSASLIPPFKEATDDGINLLQINQNAAENATICIENLDKTGETTLSGNTEYMHKSESNLDSISTTSATDKLDIKDKIKSGNAPDVDELHAQESLVIVPYNHPKTNEIKYPFQYQEYAPNNTSLAFLFNQMILMKIKINELTHRMQANDASARQIKPDNRGYRYYNKNGESTTRYTNGWKPPRNEGSHYKQRYHSYKENYKECKPNSVTHAGVSKAYTNYEVGKRRHLETKSNENCPYCKVFGSTINTCDFCRTSYT